MSYENPSTLNPLKQVHKCQIGATQQKKKTNGMIERKKVEERKRRGGIISWAMGAAGVTCQRTWGGARPCLLEDQAKADGNGRLRNSTTKGNKRARTQKGKTRFINVYGFISVQDSRGGGTGTTSRVK